MVAHGLQEAGGSKLEAVAGENKIWTDKIKAAPRPIQLTFRRRREQAAPPPRAGCSAADSCGRTYSDAKPHA